jgi:hypothetical protein
MKRRFALSLIVMTSACTAFNPEVVQRISGIRERAAGETIVVARRINEQRPNMELGFVVYMTKENAERMNAPNSEEFKRLLAERVVQKEAAIGQKICQRGYKGGSRPPFVSEGGDWKGIWMAGFDCIE